MWFESIQMEATPAWQSRLGEIHNHRTAAVIEYSFIGLSDGAIGVGNTRHFGSDAPPRPEIFVPYHQSPIQYMTLVVRSDMFTAV